MPQLSFRVRLILAFLVPIIFIVVVVIIANSAINHLAADFEQASDVNIQIVQALDALKFDVSRLISTSNELVLDSLFEADAEANATRAAADDDNGAGAKGSELEDLEEITTDFNVVLQRYADLVTGDESRETHIEELARLLQQLLETNDAVVEVVTSGSTVEKHEALHPLRVALEGYEEDLLIVINELVAQENAALDARLAEVNASVQNTQSTALLLMLGAVGATLLVSFYIFNSVVSSVSWLQQVAAQLGRGDLTVRTGMEGGDELSQVGETFDLMAQRIQELVDDLNAQVKEAESAREAAEYANRVKSAFLASMSHELRTPLNAIINFTKFVAQGDLGPVNEEQEETLTQVVDSAKHLLSLINDVLDMSKIESDSMTLFKRDNVDIAEIVDAVVIVGKSLLEDKPVEIKQEISTDLPKLTADQQRLRQILLNIITNACKFTEAGSITVRAYTENDEVVIAIRDTGVGIAPEEQAAVFEAFKQAKAGLQHGEGTGLGMPISKRLAELHGGRLWLESEVGQGSTFYVALPIQEKVGATVQ